jgi:hypothetical protein
LTSHLLTSQQTVAVLGDPPGSWAMVVRAPQVRPPSLELSFGFSLNDLAHSSLLDPAWLAGLAPAHRPAQQVGTHLSPSRPIKWWWVPMGALTTVLGFPIAPRDIRRATHRARKIRRIPTSSMDRDRLREREREQDLERTRGKRPRD